MKSVVLDTPAGIDARLGWDPSMSEHDRKRLLAKELVAARLKIDPREVLVTREAPAQFGFHTELFASVDGEELPFLIRNASFRAATVVALTDQPFVVGLDIRDVHPDDATVRDMQRHSHLFNEENTLDLIDHWTRVQAVREADGRGTRVPSEVVKLDATRLRGWIRDRKAEYTIVDLSRDGFVVTLAFADAVDAETPADGLPR
ncbi:hypothetical protein GCM10009808_17260 [Microbacterium sediminicola]|uniref:Uncharacterized protein n=1 Tax=Microbacterium sediminicola TaxID=415210 RepID=A0ABN2I805_9MICO